MTTGKRLDFLVYGVPRSGTSATAGIVSAIDGTFCLSEVFDVPAKHQDIAVRPDLNAMLEHTRDQDKMASIKSGLEFLRKNESKDVKFGNKMPKYYLRIDEKMRQLPDAKFIMCVRNLRSVMLSYNDRARKANSWHPGCIAEYAVAEQIYALKTLVRDNSDRTLVLPQESLKSNPRGCLESIRNHLWNSSGREISDDVIFQYSNPNALIRNENVELSENQISLLDTVSNFGAADLFSLRDPLLSAQLDAASTEIIMNLPDDVLAFIRPFVVSADNPAAMAYWPEFERMIRGASPLSRATPIKRAPLGHSSRTKNSQEVSIREISAQSDIVANNAPLHVTSISKEKLMSDALDRDQIVAVYRAILKRDPESNFVIQERISKGASLESLLNDALRSPEFVDRNLQIMLQRRRRENLNARSSIEVSGSPDEMKLLISHMRKVWQKFGVEDPYFSVITEQQYKINVIDEKGIEEFYQKGENDYKFFTDILEYNRLDISKDSTILDLGCGLGRVGLHFSKQFKRYIGVDISKSHLQKAERYFSNIGVKNAEFVLLTDFLQMENIADFIFSVIVLQHNPPPVIKLLIERMCLALRPGGKLIFQVPTSLKGYNFNIGSYLKTISNREGMEMHAFPQNEVYRILRDQHCLPVEVFEFDKIGPIGESTFFVAVKDR